MYDEQDMTKTLVNLFTENLYLLTQHDCNQHTKSPDGRHCT